MRLSLKSASLAHPRARDASLALKELGLEIAAGEQLVVIGPSGAGKTSLLHLCACAQRLKSGEFLIDGKQPWALNAAELKALRARLFLAPQMPPLPPRQRVVTAVLAARLPLQTSFASLRSLFYPSDIPAAEKALAMFDLQDKLFERVDRLSGGERQRVGLARLALSQAELLLVDEPLSSLDPNRTQGALRALTGLARERGATLVCSLHQVQEALEHFPRIVGLREGRLAFDLPASQVSKADLTELYAQHEAELTGPAPAVEVADLPQPTLGYACR